MDVFLYYGTLLRNAEKAVFLYFKALFRNVLIHRTDMELYINNQKVSQTVILKKKLQY